MRNREEIIRRAFEVFRADTEAVPAKTLRAGDAEDSYDVQPPYDPLLDRPTDDYLARYTFWGLVYLDAGSWRHYLPRLIDYTFRHITDTKTMAPEGLLYSLRPPDHEPPRLATLSSSQESVITAFLEELAFGDAGFYRDDALQILEEWWLPNARYRKGSEQEL